MTADNEDGMTFCEGKHTSKRLWRELIALREPVG